MGATPCPTSDAKKMAMEPDFALSLSFDGIGLALRGPDGWLRVGAVSLDVADLNAELADLRRAALGLRPGGFVTKLIIPDAQIRYLTLETGEVDTRTRQRMIVHALDGATPYRVDDLVYDWSADGGTTHVAAVARETLEEAEAFALEHRFNPVCFVAVPQKIGFTKEVFFGETAAAAEFLPEGARVERDTHAVAVTGAAPPPAMHPGPETVSESDSPAGTSPAGPETVPGFRSRRKAGSDPAETADRKSTHDPTPTFASRRRRSGPLALPAVALAKPASRPRALGPGQTRQSGTETRGPAEAAPAAVTKDLRAGPLPRGPSATGSAGGTSAAPPKRLPADPVTAPSPASAGPRARGEPAAAARRDMILRRIASLRPGAADEDSPRPETPAPSETVTDRRDRAKAASALAATRKPAGPRPPAESAAPTIPDEAARLTRFGERGRVADAGAVRGRGLALAVSAAVLLGLLGVGAYSAITSVDGIERLFGETDEAPVASVPAPDSAADPETAAAPAPVPEDPSPEEAAAAAAPEPLPEPEERAPAIRALDPDEAAARYAATGIWQMAPERPAPAAFQGIEDLYVASIDGHVPQPDAFALSQPRTTTDRAPEAPVSPPPPGSVFDLDDRGLVLATPEGALTPQGVRVIAGRPAVAPPSRAAVEERRAAEAEAEAAAQAAERRSTLADIRPPLRPAGLAEADERARLGGQTRNELAAVRPLLRPGEIAARPSPPEAPATSGPEDAVADEANAAILAATTPEGAAARAARDGGTGTALGQNVPTDAGTPQAVRASLAPATRPGGFERVVAAAPEARAQEAPAAPQPQQPQAVGPTIPSNASVARAATDSNAINLRRLNLIGVYGEPSNRRALVRLSNGRYQKVEVGDRIDGGRISAIGEDQLRYTKNGRNLVLRMPQG